MNCLRVLVLLFLLTVILLQYCFIQLFSYVAASSDGQKLTKKLITKV